MDLAIVWPWPTIANGQSVWLYSWLWLWLRLSYLRIAAIDSRHKSKELGIKKVKINKEQAFTMTS
jgi:hypothetical protein